MIDELSTEVKEKIASIPGLYDIKTSMEQGAPEVNISIDRLKSGIYGVDIASVASQIKEKLNGKTASNFESEGEPIDIEIKVPEVSLDELQNVEIVQGEKKYRLGEIAEVSITTAPKEINRSNQNRIGKVTAMLEKGYTLGSVTPEIKAQLKDIQFPTKYSAQITGKETRAPVVDRNVVNATILINGTRIKNFARFFDNVCLKCFLCHRIINILLNEIICSLFLSCTTC